MSDKNEPGLDVRSWNAALEAAKRAVEPLAVWDKRSAPGGYHISRAAVIDRIVALRKTVDEGDDDGR